MTSLEELMTSAMAATPERRREALLLLRGEMPPLQSGPPNAVPQVEPYLRLKEVAARLGVDPSTLWRWAVPGHELGGQRCFRLSEVAAYLESEAFQRRTRALRGSRKAAKAASPTPIPFDDGTQRPGRRQQTKKANSK